MPGAFVKISTSSAASLAILMMLLSASACATLTGARPANNSSAESTFCARWPDAAHPPVEIFPEDSSANADQKIDLLIVWENACNIDRP